MMAQVIGLVLAFGAAVWVLLPLFTEARAPSAEPAVPSAERRAPSAGFCSECGAALESAAHYCIHCGAPAPR